MPRRPYQPSREQRLAADRVINTLLPEVTTAHSEDATTATVSVAPNTSFENITLTRHFNPQAKVATADRLTTATFHMMQAGARAGQEVNTTSWPGLYLPVFSLSRAIEKNRRLVQLGEAPAEELEAALTDNLPASTRRTRIAKSCGTTLVRGLVVNGQRHTGIAIAVNDNVVTSEARAAALGLEEYADKDVTLPKSSLAAIVVATVPIGEGVNAVHTAFRESLIPKGAEQLEIPLDPVQIQYIQER